jgi:hypothetical protein
MTHADVSNQENLKIRTYYVKTSHDMEPDL